MLITIEYRATLSRYFGLIQSFSSGRGEMLGAVGNASAS